MSDDIFVGMVLYLLTGFLGMEVIVTSVDNEMNPLWKIPLLLLGPLTFVIFVVMGIVFLIKNYIEEVRDYYRRKDEKKGRVKYEEDFSSNRHAKRFHRWAAWNSRGRSNRR
jgi:hypothetical protein